MIFQHTYKKVLDGTKTQTRRRMKYYHNPQPSVQKDPIRVITSSRVPGQVPYALWRVGGTYTVQPGRGQKGIATIRITAIRCETAGNISDEDAIAEGFADADAFRELWEQMHGPYSLSFACWVLTFEIVEVPA